MMIVLYLNKKMTNRNQYEFALQFTSYPNGDTNTAYAYSQSLTTKVGSQFPSFNYDQLTNSTTERAVWLSYLTVSVGNRWGEAGNITFSEGNTIIFESNGISGDQIGNFSDLQYGTITYKITNGTGAYENVYGMMVDTFITDDPSNPSAPFLINAWGYFFQDI
eukprot:TRINITY_DN4158_c0_g1_i1.p1 TRINITY_DN4158_c0_g1~~TRINITY_DN4158_c0_g1_i1.p1  ORF type:complete len:163 (-),score=45.39 TRINITY_DN4158_c0_g1_i1:178-666(-)